MSPQAYTRRRRWYPTPVLLPGKSHGWRSLVGFSPWGHKELDTAEQLTLSPPQKHLCWYGVVCVCMLNSFSHVWLFATLWTAALQAPLFMGFSRQECWIGLPCPPPGDLPNPGIKPESLKSPAFVGRFFTMSAIWEVQYEVISHDGEKKNQLGFSPEWLIIPCF